MPSTMTANTKDDIALIKAATMVTRRSHPMVRRDQYTASSNPNGENGITEADAVATNASTTVRSGLPCSTANSAIASDEVAGARYGFVSSLNASLMTQGQGLEISVG